MKINLKKNFVDVYGIENTDASIHAAVAAALFNLGQSKSASRDDKIRAYNLSVKLISNDGEIDVTSEDITLIKEVAGDAFTAGGYGQIVNIVENLK